MSNDKLRGLFEAAIIGRFVESGYLPVQIRTELLPRAGEGYYDGSVDAYWDFFQKGAASVVVELPKPDHDAGWSAAIKRCHEEVIAAGGTVKS